MATKNFVPREHGEGTIGTSLKRWLNGFFKRLDVAGDANLKGNVTIGDSSKGHKLLISPHDDTIEGGHVVFMGADEYADVHFDKFGKTTRLFWNTPTDEVFYIGNYGAGNARLAVVGGVDAADRISVGGRAEFVWANSAANDAPSHVSYQFTDGSWRLGRIDTGDDLIMDASGNGTFKGNLGVGGNSGEKLSAWSTINQHGVFSNNLNAAFTHSLFVANAARTATGEYSFFRGYSGNFGDLNCNIRPDNGHHDGSWVSNGADYAEPFEWEDGNPNNEDRYGWSVVLVGNKIRRALATEVPFGVISGNPSVVGDAAWNHWNGKYLKDDFGRYLVEDYEVVEWVETFETKEGQEPKEDKFHSYAADKVPEDITVPDKAKRTTQQRRKLNPNYDDTQEYTPRSKRKEWDCVGLMGKLRLHKGEVTNPNWIKMRDISDNVEEWLVR